MGPRAGVDAGGGVRKNISSPYRNSNPRSSSPEPSAMPLLERNLKEEEEKWTK
jgi:hypothetical protein